MDLPNTTKVSPSFRYSNAFLSPGLSSLIPDYNGTQKLDSKNEKVRLSFISHNGPVKWN